LQERERGHREVCKRERSYRTEKPKQGSKLLLLGSDLTIRKSRRGEGAKGIWNENLAPQTWGGTHREKKIVLSSERRGSLEETSRKKRKRCEATDPSSLSGKSNSLLGDWGTNNEMKKGRVR